MKIVKCENCCRYYDSEALIYIQPDVGIFCPECESSDLDYLSEADVLEALNDR